MMEHEIWAVLAVLLDLLHPVSSALSCYTLRLTAPRLRQGRLPVSAPSGRLGSRVAVGVVMAIVICVTAVKRIRSENVGIFAPSVSWDQSVRWMD